MKNEVRIREDLPLEKLYEWPNPPPPRPLKRTRGQQAQADYEKLANDRARWAANCFWNGL